MKLLKIKNVLVIALMSIYSVVFGQEMILTNSASVSPGIIEETNLQILNIGQNKELILSNKIYPTQSLTTFALKEVNTSTQTVNWSYEYKVSSYTQTIPPAIAPNSYYIHSRAGRVIPMPQPATDGWVVIGTCGTTNTDENGFIMQILPNGQVATSHTDIITPSTPNNFLVLMDGAFDESGDLHLVGYQSEQWTNTTNNRDALYLVYSFATSGSGSFSNQFRIDSDVLSGSQDNFDMLESIVIYTENNTEYAYFAGSANVEVDNSAQVSPPNKWWHEQQTLVGLYDITNGALKWINMISPSKHKLCAADVLYNSLDVSDDLYLLNNYQHGDGVVICRLNKSTGLVSTAKHYQIAFSTSHNYAHFSGYNFRIRESKTNPPDIELSVFGYITEYKSIVNSCVINLKAPFVMTFPNYLASPNTFTMRVFHNGAYSYLNPTTSLLDERDLPPLFFTPDMVHDDNSASYDYILVSNESLTNDAIRLTGSSILNACDYDDIDDDEFDIYIPVLTEHVNVLWTVLTAIVEKKESLKSSDTYIKSNCVAGDKCLTPEANRETKIGEDILNEGVNVFPNPIIEGKINLSFSKKAAVNIIILDALGKEVHSIIEKPTNRIRIDVAHLNTGVYFLKIRFNDEWMVRKISIIN